MSDDALIDTNVLVRYAIISDPLHPTIRQAVTDLASKGATLYVALQNYVETWNVMTRPANKNGYGLPLKKRTRFYKQFSLSLRFYLIHQAFLNSGGG